MPTYSITGIYGWSAMHVEDYSKRINITVEAEDEDSAIDALVQKLTQYEDGEFLEDDTSGLKIIELEPEPAEVKERKEAYAQMQRYSQPLFEV